MKFIANNSACVGFSTIVGLMAALMLPSTMIQYSLENAAQVSLRACNLLGQEVATLVNDRQEAGSFVSMKKSILMK